MDIAAVYEAVFPEFDSRYPLIFLGLFFLDESFRAKAFDAAAEALLMSLSMVNHSFYLFSHRDRCVGDTLLDTVRHDMRHRGNVAYHLEAW